MALISVKGVSLGFGHPPLLDGVDLQIEAGERVGLVGRNGEGKTTLIRLIQGDLLPDRGEVRRQQGLRVSGIPQDVPVGTDGTVFDVVARGLGEKSHALTEYQRISRELADGGSDHNHLLAQQAHFQQILDLDGGWQLQRAVADVLSRMELPPADDFAALSAGLKRRVLLARALVADPDLLLLDEPTNHLDLDAINWLERFLLGCDKPLLFVTHDRMFLSRLATRIVELDRGHLSSWACDYATYVKRRQEALAAEEKQRAVFDRKLSKEEAWIRQGIKARRTRNEGRVRALEKMRAALRERRERGGTVRMQAQAAARTGRLVAEAENVDFSYDGRAVIRHFSTTILRGDKVGIIGPNGSGKTTLLRLLIGDLAPESGRVRHGVRLKTAYFDQLRASLDETRTVQENVGDGNDMLVVNGKTRHVISYLKDFLFSPERSRSPVHILSGGEKNRLLLARLFLTPSNVLVLDEPTNDLDAETLELLEDLLLAYPGTVLLVSHDRMFLNNVVTSTLVFEGPARIGEYVGGYDDWLAQRAPVAAPDDRSTRAPKNRNAARPAGPKKMGYMARRELAALPERIESLEAQQQQLYAETADPEFFKQGRDAIARVNNRLQSLEEELEAAYRRWETLEAMNTAG